MLQLRALEDSGLLPKWSESEPLGSYVRGYLDDCKGSGFPATWAGFLLFVNDALGVMGVYDLEWLENMGSSDEESMRALKHLQLVIEANLEREFLNAKRKDTSGLKTYAQACGTRRWVKVEAMRLAAIGAQRAQDDDQRSNVNVQVINSPPSVSIEDWFAACKADQERRAALADAPAIEVCGCSDTADRATEPTDR